MKIAVAQNILKNALAVVRDAVANTKDLAILGNVLIRTTADDKAEIIGTDLDVTVSTEFVCQVSEPGEITVPAKFLLSAVGAMTAGIVELAQSGGSSKATLSGGEVRYKMATLNPEDFPKAKTISGETYTLPQRTLRDMIRTVSYAMYPNNTRRNLNGVNIAKEGGVLRAQASDGRRLSLSEREIDGGADFSVIIPDRSVKFLQRLLCAEDGDVHMTVDADAIKIVAPGFVFQSRLVAEVFPNVRQVIPSSVTSTLLVDRDLFLVALRQTALVCSADLPQVVMHVKAGEIVFTASGDDAADSRSSFPVKYNGAEAKLTLNPGYLTDVLTALDSDEITLGVSDSRVPVVIKDAGGFVGIVMPMRVN